MQRSHVSFWKLWTLINIWEVVALPPVFVASVPLQGLTFAQSPTNLLDGFQCLFLGQGSAAGADDEECATLAYLYPIFVVALIAVKTLQAVVIAKFSSGLVWVVAAAAVPLASQASRGCGVAICAIYLSWGVAQDTPLIRRSLSCGSWAQRMYSHLCLPGILTDLSMCCMCCLVLWELAIGISVFFAP